jgi:glycine dehydrogenase subunit 1
LTKIPGVKRRFAAPFFNEFTIELPRSARIVNGELLRDKIVGPLPLGPSYPELTKNALVCVTETTTRADIEKLAAAVRRALEQPVQ